MAGKETNQNIYEQEFAPLLQALAEKARTCNCSCLVAVEVEGVTHISGNIIGNSPRMLEAYLYLLEESEGQEQESEL